MIEKLGKGSQHALVTCLQLSNHLNPAELLTKLRQISRHNEIQAVEANHVVDREHLMIAANHAVIAFEEQFNISKSIAMECLIYASAQSQIETAIKKLGVSSGTTTVGLIIFSEIPNSLTEGLEKISRSGMGVVDETLIDAWDDKRRADILEIFSLTNRQIRAARRLGESERDAIKKLVLEKMALLSLEAQRS